MIEERKDTSGLMVDRGIKRVAELLKKPEKAIKSAEVLSINKDHLDLVRTDSPDIELYTKERLIKAFGPIDFGSNRKWQETIQSFVQAADLIDGSNPKGNSYGIFLPSYEIALKQQKGVFEKQKIGSKEKDYQSLLIGSLTLETAVEYETTINLIFPRAKTYFIDLEGEEIKKTPGFLFANGLHLPFKKDTFSSIHTNYLFRMLEGNGLSEQPEVKVGHLFEESFRVLKSDGWLMMCEGDFQSFISKDEMERMLQQRGFFDISINPAVQFATRRDMVNYFESDKNRSSIKKIPAPKGTFMITAIKR